MRVFRDKTSLVMTPELWPTIQEALTESEYFLLLASPQAAQSPWVQKEVGWWLQHRTAQTLFIVLTEGEAVWDETIGDFNWSNTNALSAILDGKFKHEPLYVDLRWAKTVENLSLRHSQFRPAILDIFAALLGRPKDELDGEDVQQHRRFRTITRLVIVTLTLLTLLLIAGISGLITQIRETGEKTSQLLATQSKIANDSGQLDRAFRFGILAAHDTWLSPATSESEPELASLAHTSTMQASFLHGAKISSAEFSANGATILTASEDKTVRVWNIVTGREQVRFSHENEVMSATYSPDGNKVVTVSGDG